MEIVNQADMMFKFMGFSGIFSSDTSLEEGLREVAMVAAQTLTSQRCSIMLLTETKELVPILRLLAHYGDIPDIAYQQMISVEDGIAGYVARTGESVLVADILRSQFVDLARYPMDEKNKSLISTPICWGQQVIGVMNMSGCLGRESFGEKDLELLRLFAIFVAKSIHVAHLQTIMRSKFIERAVLLEWEEQHPTPIKQATLSPAETAPDPNRLAKIVAKSFFKELTQAGFSTNQIIAIATEVLNLLQNGLNKHKKRLARDEGDLEE